MFLKAFACVDLVMLVLDPLHLGSFTSLHKRGQVGSPIFALDFTSPEFLISLRSLLQPGLLVLLCGLSSLDSSTLAFGSSSFGLFPLLQSFAKSGLVLFTFGTLGFGFSISLQSSCCPEPSMLALGLMCLSSSVSCMFTSQIDSSVLVDNFAQVDYSLFVFTETALGLLLLPRGFSHLDSTAPLLDFVHVASLLLLRQSACSGSSLSLVGMSCCDFSTSVFHGECLGPSSFLHSFARVDPLVLMFGFADLGSLVFSRSFCQLSFVVSVFGVSTLDFLPLVLDFGMADLSASLQSLVRVELVMLMFDSSTSGTSSPVQSLVRVGFVLLVCGTLRIEYTTKLSVVGACKLGLTLSLQSLACFDFALFPFNSEEVGFLLLPQSLARPNPSFFVLGMSRSGTLVLIVDHGQLDLTVFAFGSGEIGGALLAAGLASIGFLLLLKSSAQSDFFVLLFNFVDTELSTSLKGFAWAASALLILGKSNFGCFPPMCDYSHLGPMAFAQSFFCTNPSLFALDFSNLASAASLHSFLHLGLLIPAFDAASPELPLFLQQFLRVNSFPFTTGIAQTELPTFTAGVAHIGLALLLQGFARLALSSSVSDASSLGFPLLVQSFARPGLVAFALDFLHSESSVFLRGVAHLDLALLFIGKRKPLHVTCLSVADFSFVDSTPSVRSHARPGSLLSVFDLTQVNFLMSTQSPSHIGFVLLLSDASFESSLLLRSFACGGSCILIFGLASPDSSLSALDFIAVDLAVSIKSFARLGSPASILDNACLELFLPPHSLARIDLAVFVSDYLTLGFSMLLQRSIQFEPQLSCFGKSQFGFLLSPISYTNVGSSLSMRGWSRGIKSLPVCLFASVGFSLLLRSPAYCDSAMLVFDPSTSGLLLLIQGSI